MSRLSGSCHYLRLHPPHIPPKVTVQSVTNVCTSLPVRTKLKLGQPCVSIGCSIKIDPLHSFTIDDIELKCKHHFHWSWLVSEILSRIIANIYSYLALKNMTAQLLQTVNAAPCAVDLPSPLMADSSLAYETRVASAVQSISERTLTIRSSKTRSLSRGRRARRSWAYVSLETSTKRKRCFAMRVLTRMPHTTMGRPVCTWLPITTRSNGLVFVCLPSFIHLPR